MNVLHLATFDTHGGAAVAALRLVEGLRARGHAARLLVRERATAHAFVEAVAGDAARPRSDATVTRLAWLFAQRARSARSDALFSIDLPTFDLATHPAVRAADVLHLHWVAGFLSAYEIRRLQGLGKPVVWTLHDQFPFTGGCHYAHGCRGFMTTCSRCPQLQHDAQPLARLTLLQKRDFIDPSRLVVVTPSQWLAKCARASALFARARIEVVPYGIDVGARQHVTRDAARRALGLPANAAVIFAASANNTEIRKGDAHLAAALGRLRAARARTGPALQRRLLLLTAGEGARDGDVDGLRCHSLGALSPTDDRLTMAYRAADVFVLPSLEDNLPNTLLEAMAAGLPVVAYRTGGIPDFLEDGVNGRVVKQGDRAALARAIAAVLGDDDGRQRLGAAAAATARRVFDLPIQAAAYERIYADELDRRSRSRRGKRRARRAPALSTHPLADAPRLKRLVADRTASGLFTTLLQEDVDALHRLVASRGGDIRGLEAQTAWLSGEVARETAALQDVIAARGGEIRDLRTALTEAERNAAEMQRVIADRGGEIRELRRTLASGLDGDQRLERLRRLIVARRATPRPSRPTVGVFGAGEGGMRVIDTVLQLDCTVGWLSDNNPEARRRVRLGCDVIAPDEIPRSPFDVIVIGSAHRDSIRAQLIHLGVAADRIVTPDVSQPDEGLADELRRLLPVRVPGANGT